MAEWVENPTKLRTNEIDEIARGLEQFEHGDHNPDAKLVWGHVRRLLGHIQRTSDTLHWLKLERQRDEARSEVERLQREVDELNVRLRERHG